MTDGEGAFSPDETPEVPGVVLTGELGRGGMGVVYRGRQTFLERDVAVKVLLGAGPGFVRRFEREAKILANLSHPNIVACYQAGGTATGDPYLVMEMVNGPTLGAWGEEVKRVPIVRALRIARDVAQALHYAHRRGVIHRDIKLENVLLARSPDSGDPTFPYVVKVVDLGLARFEAGMREDLDVTQGGTILGTPSCMAPEQIDGVPDLDQRVDIYALGCLLFHLLTGKRAFDADGLSDLILKKIRGQHLSARGLRADVPDAVCELLDRMLAPEREERVPDYDTLLAELDRAIEVTRRQVGSGRLEAADAATQDLRSRPTRTLVGSGEHRRGSADDRPTVAVSGKTGVISGRTPRPETEGQETVSVDQATGRVSARGAAPKDVDPDAVTERAVRTRRVSGEGEGADETSGPPPARRSAAPAFGIGIALVVAMAVVGPRIVRKLRAGWRPERERPTAPRAPGPRSSAPSGPRVPAGWALSDLVPAQMGTYGAFEQDPPGVWGNEGGYFLSGVNSGSVVRELPKGPFRIEGRLVLSGGARAAVWVSTGPGGSTFALECQLYNESCLATLKEVAPGDAPAGRVIGTAPLVPSGPEGVAFAVQHDGERLRFSLGGRDVVEDGVEATALRTFGLRAEHDARPRGVVEVHDLVMWAPAER